MNQSRFPTLATAAAALATQMALAPGAEATAVPIIQNSTLTGIDGLDVQGTLYDVTFVPDTGVPVPQFKTESSALAASQVLGVELVTLSTLATPPSFRIFTVFGESTPFANVIPSAFEVVLGNGNVVPRSFEILGPLAFFPQSNGTASEFFDSPIVIEPIPFSGNGSGDYAIFTAVPEPSSLVLLGVGMAGVAAAGAVRRKKKSA